MRYIKMLGWILIIAYLCFSPASEFKNVTITLPHFDKVVHFGMFFILGTFIAAFIYFDASKLHKIWFPLLAIAYGGIIELIQLNYIYKRNGDWFDWLADVLGMLLALGFFNLLSEKLKRVLVRIMQ